MHSLGDRAVVLRLGLCLAALIALLFAVQCWRVPFSVRLGDHPPRGVLARVDFERVNRFETERARRQAEAQVPLTFRNQSGLLKKLPAQLHDDLDEIARADSINEVSDSVRVAFGLTRNTRASDTDRSTPLPRELIQQQFESLRQATADQNGIAYHNVDEITARFATFIDPLSQLGILDPADLSSQDLGSSDEIGIVDENQQTTRAVLVSDVLLADLLNEEGLLGRTWASWPDLIPIRESLQHWLVAKAPPTLRYDDDATKAARRAASLQVEKINDRFHQNDVLVAPGQVIDDERMQVLRDEYDRVEELLPTSQRLFRAATVFLMILVLAALNGYYLINNEPKLVASAGRLSVYLAAVVAAVALGRVMSFDPWRAEIIPLVVTAMVFAVAYNQVLATLTAFTLTVVLTLATMADLGSFVIMMTVSSIATLPLAHVPTRTTLVKAGFVTALAYVLVSWGMAIIQTQSLNVLWEDRTLLMNGLRGAGWCLVAGYLVAGSLPFIESTFGVVTDISLLEMSDISHPLLQGLVRRAPGTYNHSIAVATIGETAADRIGANGLLVRVGAYFHDIGKMLKPQYFIENMTEGAENRHDHLAPAMSTLIIIGHVKDGVDLAQQHNLPQPLIDFIEQHHGTTLVQYFYHEASKQADDSLKIEESSFRYPGPKPQSREAGVMMLADAVESASRTLSEPTAKRIETLVHEITMAKLLDGQFDESSLTLSEIHEIEDSLTKSLIGIYHGRIQYPEQRTA